jgi:hypothetical protein
MNLFQRWKQTTIANQLMVITTAVVAFGTLFYVGVAIFQYCLMKESARQASEQTDRLIAATQRMADTTVEALKEAKRSNEETAKRAERAIQVSRDFADAATSQAETSKKSAKAAESSATAAQKGVEVMRSGILIANRAYISIDKMKFLNPLEPNKPVIVTFEFVNDGNSSAEVNSAGTWYFDTSLRPCDYSAKPASGGTIVAPKSPRFKLVTIFQQGLSQSDIEAIQQGRKVFQMCTKGTYTTLNESYPLEHCSYYFPELNTFMECKK